jgi:superfamily I DNA and/or RNA helicase
VAQYLAPGQLKFDLIVMDEASQLKPEDAIGALARGGQVVIVGDPKQLPPTSFFQRVSLDAEEDSLDDSRTALKKERAFSMLPAPYSSRYGGCAGIIAHATTA